MVELNMDAAHHLGDVDCRHQHVTLGIVTHRLDIVTPVMVIAVGSSQGRNGDISSEHSHTHMTLLNV